MTENQKAAYIQAQATCAMITALGMQAENMQQEATGHSMAYNDKAFIALIERYGLHHNALSTFLGGI